LEESYYPKSFNVEKKHWWFRARRRLAVWGFPYEICSSPHSKKRVIDLGCGTGSLMDDLTRFGTVFGMDFSAVPLSFCRKRNIKHLIQADCTAIPLKDNSFDIVFGMDLIEHLENDQAALEEMMRICAPGGYVVLSVPAFMWLWSTRDERLHHKRRYTLNQINQLINRTGLVPVKSSYIFLFFFPAMAILIFFNRLLKRKTNIKEDVPTPPPWLNGLYQIFMKIEFTLMQWINYPFGVSIFAVAQK
jgi:ubiquinone/menaquinone biosynthesis C-methylase UbiE